MMEPHKLFSELIKEIGLYTLKTRLSGQVFEEI